MEFHPGFLRTMPKIFQRFLLIYLKTVLTPEMCPANENMPMYVPLKKRKEIRSVKLYGPVSLTCIASKVLKHIVHSHVTKHLSQYGVLTDYQHRSRAEPSTETQLICTIHDIASAIQSNKTIHVAILDFSKASV